jgi:hypothetical protein
MYRYYLPGPFPLTAPLVPTNTTSTAAYVAVATIVSLLSVLNMRLKISGNIITAIETVMRLFARDECRTITTIGIMRAQPPSVPTINRANESRNGE